MRTLLSLLSPVWLQRLTLRASGLFRADTQQSHYSGFGCKLPCDPCPRPSCLPHAPSSCLSFLSRPIMSDQAADARLQQVLAALQEMTESFREERRERAEEREAMDERIRAIEEKTTSAALPQTPRGGAAVTSPLLDSLGALRSAMSGFPPVATVKPAQRSLLFGREPTSAQPGSVAAAVQPASPAPIKGLPKPDKFAGADVKERASARTWVQSVSNWMELSVPDRSDEDKVRVFATFLSGDALRWFEQQRAVSAAQHLPLSLATVIDLFVKRMQADDALAHLTAEFLNLTLWASSDCNDLHATEAAFDSRALVLYPGASLTVDGDAMLAGLYGQVIQRGDRQLWEDALRHAPRTLAQWKAAVQQSHTIREARKVGRQASRPVYQGWRQQSGEQSVRANQASAAAAGKHEAEAAAGTPDEAPAVSAQFAAAASSKQHTQRRGFRQISDDQFKQLKASGRCLDCYSKGHRWWKCPVAKEKLPSRSPSAEELNA